MSTSFALAEVTITPSSHDPQALTVRPIWSGVDRPDGHGWGVPNTPRGRKLATRLKAAIEAGAVFPDAHVATDVNGKTYVAGSATVMGRYLNADLTALGF